MKYFKPIVDTSLAERTAVAGRGRRKKPDPRTPLAKSTIVDGYRVEKVIGRGSFSIVYSAIELKSGVKVVVKEYYPKHFARRDSDGQVLPLDKKKQLIFHEGLKKFYSEALTLKQVSHPNVLNTHNFFNANHTAYLVSLNQDGRDLKWFLSSFEESLGPELIYKVFMPALSALNYLHGADLLHLDIKPANILLQPNGQSMLLDFGAAQSVNSSMRINRKQVLTHGFAPPEQYDKNRALGPWTDIYAVAASLYYCVSCTLPAKSKDSKVASSLDVSKFCGRYHSELIRTINRSLSYDETARFASVDDFAAALLEGARWRSLLEYEVEVMDYDRFAQSTRHSQDQLALYAA